MRPEDVRRVFQSHADALAESITKGVFTTRSGVQEIKDTACIVW